eukprot:2596807-Karenia_brevis.AAC.1
MMSDKDLDHLFERRTPLQKQKRQNFLTYVAGSNNDRSERRVRVNCKYDPWDSQIRYPPYMEDYKKTTMVRYYGDKRWKVFEDRIEPTNNDYVYDAEYM